MNGKPPSSRSVQPDPAATLSSSFKIGKDQVTLEFLPSLLVRGSTHPAVWLTDLACPAAAAALAEVREIEVERKALALHFSDALYRAIPEAAPLLRPRLLDAKRRLQKAPTEIPPPPAAEGSVLPDDLATTWKQWNALVLRREVAWQRAQEAFAVENPRTRSHLVQLFADPAVAEGVLLSSQQLFQGIERRLKKDLAGGAGGAKADRQLERALTEYLTRTILKTTPRGLITGVGVAEWGASARGVRFAPAGSPGPLAGSPLGISRRRTLLSLPLVRTMAKSISQEFGLEREVVVRPNTTLFRKEGKYCFIHADEAGERLFAIAENRVLTRFIELATPRSLTAGALVDRMCAEFSGERNREEISRYYQGICRKGILIGHLEIPFEFRDGLAYLVDWLTQAASASGVESAPVRERLAGLEELCRSLRGVDEAIDWAHREKHYGDLKQRIVSVLPDRERRPLRKLVINESVCSPASFEVGADVRGELANATRICFSLLAASGLHHSGEATARRFLEKIGILAPGQREGEFPLSRLIEEEGNGQEYSRTDTDVAKSARYLETLLHWLSEKSEGPAPVRSLDLEKDGLLERMEALGAPGVHQSPGDGAIEFQLAADSAADLESGRYLVVLSRFVNALSPNFSRFCEFLGDPGLDAQLAEHAGWLRRHCDADAEWTEALTQFCGRTDTAILHTLYHDRVIELYGSRVDGSGDRVIPIGELYVRLRDANGLELLWRKDGEAERRVRAVYSSYRDLQGTPPLISFFHALGWNIAMSPGSWHDPAMFRQGHVPRLTVGKVVLRREAWLFDRTALPAAGGLAPLEALRTWQSWRTELGLPRYVFVLGAGKPYFVDFDSPCTLDVLISDLSQSQAPKIRFTEMLPHPGQLWAGSPAVPRSGFATQFMTGIRWTAS